MLELVLTTSNAIVVARKTLEILVFRKTRTYAALRIISLRFIVLARRTLVVLEL